MPSLDHPPDGDPRPQPTSRPVPAPDPAQLRAGDADHESVAELLRAAAGDGRLTLGELEERLDAAYAARTYGELQRVTADLPSAAPLTPGSAPAVERMVAVFGNERRAGRWEVPARIDATAVLGDVVIDLSEAVPRHPEVVIEAFAVVGDVKVVVPEGVLVVMEPGVTVLGDRKCTVPAPQGPPALTVRVRGTVVFGNIKVRPPRTRRRWLGR